MSAVQDMIADLAVVPQLLAAQTKAGAPHDECLGAIFRSWAKKLKDTRCLKDDDKVTLTNAVQSAPFTGEQNHGARHYHHRGASIQEMPTAVHCIPLLPNKPNASRI